MDRHSFRKGLCVAVLVVLLAGCSTGAIGTTADDTIVIGAIAPLTGDVAAYGIPAQRVIDLRVDEINAAGGIDGKKIVMKWEDGQCNANAASVAGQKLISIDRVQVILAFCSMEVLALAPLAEPANVLILSPLASNPSITDSGDYVFRDFPSDSSQGTLGAKVAFDAGYTKAVILAEQTDYALGLKDVFVEQFESYGGETTIETYSSDTTDFRTSLLKLQQAGAELVVVYAQTPTKYSLIFKQMEDMGWNPAQMIVSEVAGGDTSLLKEHASFMEGMWSVDFSYDQGFQGFNDLMAAYQQKYGEELPYKSFGATSYDAISVLAEAIDAVGYDAAKMKDYLYTVKDRVGAIGKLSFDANGDLVGGYSLVQAESGKWVLKK